MNITGMGRSVNYVDIMYATVYWVFSKSACRYVIRSTICVHLHSLCTIKLGSRVSNKIIGMGRNFKLVNMLAFLVLPYLHDVGLVLEEI